MPLLEAGRPIADPYVAVGDDVPLPEDAPVLMGLDRFLREPARNAQFGVVLPPTVAAEPLAMAAASAAMIAVEFPRFRDGRGFTIGHRLRERHGFAGEIRAIGHILPDQYRYLVRCGFNTVQVADDADLAPWQAALARFDIAYQHGLAPEQALSGLRRRLQGP